MHSDAATVEQYLAGLDDDRRAQFEPVHEAVRDPMPGGYAESARCRPTRCTSGPAPAERP